MQPIQQIAFFGATGMLGRPVVAALLLAGYQVKALVRNPPQAKLPSGVNIITGDLKDPASIAATIQGCQAVYISLSVGYNEGKNDWHPEEQGLANILATAKEAGIARVAYLSSFIKNSPHFQDWWVFQLKNKAEAAIKASGLAYTIFCPSAFFETIVTRQVQGNNLQHAGKGLYKLNPISGMDYGRMVAKSFQTQAAINQTYLIQGPESLTPEEMYLRFIQHYKKQSLKLQVAPLGMLKFIGLFSKQLNFAHHIIEAINTTPEPFAGEQAWQDLVQPTETIAQFAESQSMG